MILIPYNKQQINNIDIEAVVNALKSAWLTQGPVLEQFERAVAEYCGARYAVAVSNGTAALHIACLAAGLGKDDILWTSPNTFIASANCALYCGARPDFVDIDPRTYNMSISELEAKLFKKKKTGHLPKIVIPVHFAGQSCEMEQIYSLSKKYDFIAIEDACHALGGSYKESKIGSCKFSDITVFSFHPVKTITTGEGGMVLTNNENLYQKLIRLRTHGITKNTEFIQGKVLGAWCYEQIELGFNYRLTDIQAALGCSQMLRLNAFVERRRRLAKRYDALLKSLPLVLPYQHPDSNSAFHLYPVRLKLNEISKSREQVFDELRKAGIGVNVHYIPVHTQPFYQRLGFKTGDFPVAEGYYQEAISLPLYYDLTDDNQDFVISIASKVLA